MSFRNIKTAEQIAADKRKAEIASELSKAKSDFVEATQEMLQGAPKEEIDTFYKQEYEARTYLADNTFIPPYLSVLAQERGETVSELANKVIKKADAYSQHAKLLGAYQVKIKQLESELGALEV